MNYILILTSLILINCVENNDTCLLPIDQGTWHAEYIELSGNCGEMPDEIIQFPKEESNECRITKQLLDQDECKLQRTVKCQYDNVYLEMVSSVEQIDEDLFNGTVSVYIKLYTGEACRSVYNTTIREL